jgi:HEAT repeat protein
MGVVQAARLFALQQVFSTTGLKSAGRALVDALSSPDETTRAIAGMFLVQAGKRAEPLVEEAMSRRQSLPTVLVIAGDIGAFQLEPQLRRFTADPDPEVARAARDGLSILDAQPVQPSGRNG